MSNEIAVIPTQKVSPLDAPEFDYLGKEAKAELTVLIKSGLFLDAKDIHKVSAKVMMGKSLGLNAAESLRNIIVGQNGAVSFTANFMAYLIKASKKYRYSYAFEDKTGACTVKVMERVDSKWEDAGTSTFGPDDAKRAGLDGKETYKKYPRNLYFARAISNACKWSCPDLFGGNTPYLPDEVPNSGIEVDGETLEVMQVTTAKPVQKAFVKPVNKPAHVAEQKLPQQLLTELEEEFTITGLPVTTWLSLYDVRELDELSEWDAVEMLKKLREKRRLDPV